jgi:hypothetical protein
LGHNFAITEVMEDVMSVREVSIEYADKKLKELPQPQPKVKGKKRRHYPDKDVDDN